MASYPSISMSIISTFFYTQVTTGISTSIYNFNNFLHFRCISCQERFTTKRRFLNHCKRGSKKCRSTQKQSQSNSLKIINDKFSCTLCKFTSKFNTSLLRHIRRFHSGSFITKPKPRGR